jgi:glycosyltransferase involved in cell wall biosynthesis
MVPLKASEIARALSALMSDPEQRAVMGANGRQHAADTLTWDTVARTMVENYRTF